MEDSFDYKEEAENNSEKEFDKVLRPQKLVDFAGQPSIVENLEIFVKAAKLRKEPLDHVLLHGPPGLGKTTLAKVLFQELDVSSYDILEINASRENSVDTVREKINNFVQIMPFGAYKICIT